MGARLLDPFNRPFAFLTHTLGAERRAEAQQGTNSAVGRARGRIPEARSVVKCHGGAMKANVLRLMHIQKSHSGYDKRPIQAAY